MKIDVKVAWPKTDPFTEKCFEVISSGDSILHEEMLAAVADPDHRKIFDPSTHQEPVNGTHVIFQYVIFLRRRDGRVAVFNRALKEMDAKRMNAGRSIFISRSIPLSPYHALPRILNNLICVSETQEMGTFIPRGLAINPMPPVPNPNNPGIPWIKPTYLFAIYENVFPDDLILHGRFHDTPDKFIGWMKPEEFGNQFKASGKVDQVISEMLVDGQFQQRDEGGAKFKYSPNSFIHAKKPIDSNGDEVLTDYEIANYLKAHNVFISHAAEDSFSAYALYRLLIDESSRRIYPTIDLEHLKDGDKLDRIREEFIESADSSINSLYKA